MFEVTVTLGDRLVTKYRGQGETMIGRDPGCEVMLDNLGVSRRHAHLREVEGNYIIEDQNSTNGVFVNGHRISNAAQIQPGDEVRIGKFRLSVREARGEPLDERIFDINRTIALDEPVRPEAEPTRPEPMQPEPKQPEPSQPGFVASVTRDVFHKVDCNWIKATPANYKVYFDSRDQATRAGKRPCRTCFPQT